MAGPTGGGAAGLGGPIGNAAQPAKWTLMIYMAADNNLEDAAVLNLMQLESVAASTDVNVVVEVATKTIPIKGSTTAKRLWIQPTTDPNNVTSPILQDRGQINTADPNEVADFVKFSVGKFPSTHTALILWDHGASFVGWDVDETANKGPLNYAQMKQMFQSIQTNLGGAQLDIIGWDACLMGGIEMDEMLVPFGKLVVASEELEPAAGWAYDAFLGALVANPAQDAPTLAKSITDTSFAAWENAGLENVTLSTVDLTQVTPLVAAVTDFSAKLTNAVPTEGLGVIAVARRKALQFDAGDTAAFVDVASFAQLVQTDPSLGASAQKVVAAVTAAVMDAKAGTERPGAAGISTHFPPNKGEVIQGFAATDFATATGWGTFLNTLEQNLNAVTTPPSVKIVSANPTSPTQITYNIGSGVFDTTLRITQKTTATTLTVIGEIDLAMSAAGTHTTQWNGTTIQLSDGTTTLPIQTQPFTPGSASSFALLRYTPKGGATTPAWVQLSVKGTAVNVDGIFTNTNGATAQVTLAPGDKIAAVYDVINTGGGARTTTTSTTTLTALAKPVITATSTKLATGNYVVVVAAEDAVFNLGIDTANVSVP